MDMKIFILGCGALLIAAVIAHGLWVARRSRRNPLKMELAEENVTASAFDAMELLRGELPNGGARVAPSQGPAIASGKQPLQQDEALFGESEIAPGIDTLPFGEVRIDGEISNDAPIVAEGMPSRLRRTRKDGEEGSKQTRREKDRSAILELDDPTDLVVVSVMDSEGERWNGSKVLEELLRHGLKYGDMNIFHRIDEGGVTQFSVANAIEPGSFDLADIKAMATPGITMFLRIPELRDPLSAYDDMLSVAKDTARTLGGELRDERMSLMTSQVIDHYRQQIIEFARKKMSVRA